VSTGPTCTWTAESGAGWINVESGRSYKGNAEVRYRVAPNTSTQPRSAALSIANRSFSVQQDGAKPAEPEKPDKPDEKPDKVDVEGNVGSLSGSCPSLSFTVRGQAVITDGSTEFKKSSCRDIRNGVEVKVKGERRGSGPIRAERVEVEN
jgi:Domain of unknown function (DUF5666)/Putative binding domain, N-terminal